MKLSMIAILLFSFINLSAQTDYFIVGKNKIELKSINNSNDLYIADSEKRTIITPEYQKRQYIGDAIGRFYIKVYRPSSEILIDYSVKVNLDSINNKDYFKLMNEIYQPTIKGFDFFHMSNDQIIQGEYEVLHSISGPNDISNIIFEPHLNIKRGDKIIIGHFILEGKCTENFINAMIMFEIV